VPLPELMPGIFPTVPLKTKAETLVSKEVTPQPTTGIHLPDSFLPLRYLS